MFWLISSSASIQYEGTTLYIEESFVCFIYSSFLEFYLLLIEGFEGILFLKDLVFFSYWEVDMGA